MQGNDTPTAAARAKCHLGTLAPLQRALAKLLRLIPAYIAIPMRTIPSTAAAADETYECFRDEVDIRMGDRRMPFITTSERTEELREREDLVRAAPVRVNAT